LVAKVTPTGFAGAPKKDPNERFPQVK